MALEEFLMLFALSASSALAGFLPIANQHGWPRGALFAQSNVPTAVASGSAVVVAGRILAGITADRLGWSWLLWGLLAFFVGGPLLLAVVRRWSGPLMLLAAPSAAIASFLA